MKRVIAVALGAAALAGCAGHATYKPPAAKLLRPASVASNAVLTAPAPQNGKDWFMAVEGDKAKLAYGPANSDDVGLMLVCAKGSGKVSLTRPVAADQAGSPPILALASGSARGRWLATTEPSAGPAGRTDLKVETATTDPAIDAFQRNGWVSAVLADGKTEGMAAQPGEQAVRRFFDFCG